MKHNFANLPGALALGSLLTAALLTVVAPQARAANPQGGVPVAQPILLPPFTQTPGPLPFLQVVSPFAIIGFIQNATLDPACLATDPLCGGTVTVNGLTVVIPRNTILQMPAFGISWADLFRSAPAPYGPTQTGLALGDTPKPFSTYQINITGNRVVDATGDQYRAGLVLISQDPANASQGYINFIDYSPTLNGRPAEMWVGSTLKAKTGSRLRINSPGGRYATPDPLADPRFTADEDNPTMHAETGFPMCLPRIDPAVAVDSQCPQWNRPASGGTFAQIFTMPAYLPGVPIAGITHRLGYPAPPPGVPTPADPFEQAPFEVGDYVTYSGTLVNDVVPCVAGLPASSCQYISANTIVASLGVYTAPGSKPAYMSIEGQTLGVGDVPNPLFPQEGVEKLVLTAFSTDSTQLVDMYAVDRNPVTGVASHRFYATADPFGPPVGAVKSRARIRTFIGNFLPPTREMAVATRTLTGGAPVDSILPTMMITANGLKAGYYLAPTFTFIFPENFLIGGPQVALAFQEFPFIVNGSGPYAPSGFTAASAAQVTAVSGQLSPFPSSSAPPQGTGIGLTSLLAPISKAGFPQTVTEGSLVTLDGSGSIDPNVPALTINYTWAQSAGPAATLLTPNGPHPQFVAPTLPPGSTPVTLTFQLAVCNGFTCSGISTVSITELARTTGPSVTLSSAPGQNVLSGTVVTLTGTSVTGTTFTFTQTGFGGLPPVVLTTVGTNQARFTAPTPPAGTPLPVNLAFKVTVKDAAGLTATDVINIFVGVDAITIIDVTYSIRKSELGVTVRDNVPNGAASILMTAQGITGAQIGVPVVLTYDPITNSYIIGGANLQINPIPNTVKFTSTFGGTKTSPITVLLR